MSDFTTEGVHDPKSPAEITAIIHDVITSFTDKSSYALNQSRYAPLNTQVCLLFLSFLVFFL